MPPHSVDQCKYRAPDLSYDYQSGRRWERRAKTMTGTEEKIPRALTKACPLTAYDRHKTVYLGGFYASWPWKIMEPRMVLVVY